MDNIPDMVIPKEIIRIVSFLKASKRSKSLDNIIITGLLLREIAPVKISIVLIFLGIFFTTL